VGHVVSTLPEIPAGGGGTAAGRGRQLCGVTHLSGPRWLGRRDPFGEISGIPTTLIVDRRGKLVQRWSGYGEGMAKRALDEALRSR